MDMTSMATLFAPIAHRPVETAVCAYVGGDGAVLGLRHMAGTSLSIAVPIRRVAADALSFDAGYVVMAHNHPSGDPTPSELDFAFTRKLARALESLDVGLFDHLVLAGERRISMREMGFL